MTKPDISIELGYTGGFRYIGIQPPLTDEQRGALVSSGVNLNLGFHNRAPYIGHPYTEGGIMIGIGTGDEYTVSMAHRTAEVLRGLGSIVSVNETFQAIGCGRYLFGGQDRQLG